MGGLDCGGLGGESLGSENLRCVLVPFRLHIKGETWSPYWQMTRINFHNFSDDNLIHQVYRALDEELT